MKKISETEYCAVGMFVMAALTHGAKLSLTSVRKGELPKDIVTKQKRIKKLGQCYYDYGDFISLDTYSRDATHFYITSKYLTQKQVEKVRKSGVPICRPGENIGDYIK